MRKFSAATSLAVILLATACSDRNQDRAPTAPRRFTAPDRSATLAPPGTCTTLAALDSLANLVFGAGSPNAQSVLGKIDNLGKLVAQGNIVDAQAQAQNIVSFVVQKASQGTLPGTTAQINALLGGVLCYAGLNPDEFLIQPTDPAQILTSSTGKSGISLQANTVAVATLITINTLDPNAPSPIITKLDQYPTIISVTSSSQLTKPSVVAICLGVNVPPDVFARLRLAHQATAGFEITPNASAAFLNCPTVVTSVTSASRVPRWLDQLASLVLPKALYARQIALVSGGVGGTATEYSPFDAVDPQVNVTAGVAGTCPSPSATVGTALDPACRPVVTIATPTKGTLLTNVPVSWQVATGGGVIAPDTLATQTCGSPFGSTAATATDASGKASVCWTLGPNGGTNTVVATPSAGGDVPAGATFNPVNQTFTATGTKITPTATATGASVTYDGLPHPGSGACSNGLTPALTYSGDGSVPTNVGSYTLTVTCGDGGIRYVTVNATATITIALYTPLVSVTCPVSVVYNGSPQTPCSATVTAPGLSLTPIPAYASNTAAGTATATVNFTAVGNYAAAMGSATFTIAPAPTTTTVTCSPSSVVYNGAAQTPCSAIATGPGNLSASVPVTYGANTNVGTATANATFAATANYLTSSATTVSFKITTAPSVTTVLCPVSVVFTGSDQNPCTASVSGVGGLSQALAIAYTPGAPHNAGAYTASASFAGDVNHSGSSNSGTVQVTRAVSVTTVSCPASVAYNGSDQIPCTASVSGAGGLSQALAVTYASGTPHNAGAYTASAGYAGDVNHFTSSGTAGFSITRLAATATAGSGSMDFGTTVPALPCTVTGLLGVDAGLVACTTSVPPIISASIYATTPTVTPASPVNYTVQTVNGALTVRGYVQSGCFSSPIYSSLPATKSFQNGGSNLPVKCTLLYSNGSAVQNATGNLLVQDLGPTGTAPPVFPPAFSGVNVFKASNGGQYAFGLNTSGPAFISGHYYFVTGTWNDGSTTTGFFLIK